jgi:hypothetical protein
MLGHLLLELGMAVRSDPHGRGLFRLAPFEHELHLLLAPFLQQEVWSRSRSPSESLDTGTSGLPRRHGEEMAKGARALGGGGTVAVMSVTASARRSRNRASRDRGGASSMSPAASPSVAEHAARESGTAARRAAAERSGRAPAAAAASAASMSAISSSLTMSTGKSSVLGRAAADEEGQGEREREAWCWCISETEGAGKGTARCGPPLFLV